MKQMLWSYLTGLGLDKVQTARGLRILPLLATKQDPFQYVSLSSAISERTLIITEVSEAGSVPNLKAINEGALPVLLLDGEEVRGAKQNRILNTSVLLDAKTQLIIPVSCTESGRWNYHGRQCDESENFLSGKMRSSKMTRVNDSLKENRGYDAGQSDVWHEIQLMSREHNANSPTNAMADVFAHAGKSLAELCEHFPLLEGQCGIYVEIDGKFAGMDILSLPSVWKDVHDKIIRSYAIEVIKQADPEPEERDLNPDAVFALISDARETSRPAIGLGVDTRLEGKQITGSVLSMGESFVHTAIYPVLPKAYRENYSSPRQRRVYIY